MGVEMKTCTKCGRTLPATLEFFPANKAGKNGLNARCRECVNAYRREWANNHPENVKASAQKYRAANKDKYRKWARDARQQRPDIYRAGDRRHYLRHREKRLAYQRWYRETHKEAVAQVNKSWRERNREYLQAKSKQWRLENYQRYRDNIRAWLARHPERKEAYFRMRAALEKGLPHDLTRSQWVSTLGYFDHACAYCGSRDALTQDHVVPLCRGGGYVYGNIVPACKSCNSSKADSDLLDWYPHQPFFSQDRLVRIQTFGAMAENRDHAVGGAQQ